MPAGRQSGGSSNDCPANKRERADLQQNPPPARAQQKDPDDKQEVIDASRENMRIPESEVLPRNLGPRCRRRRSDKRHRNARPRSFEPQCLQRAVADAHVQRVRPIASPYANVMSLAPAGTRPVSRTTDAACARSLKNASSVWPANTRPLPPLASV